MHVIIALQLASMMSFVHRCALLNYLFMLSIFVLLTDFPLTLARWPMASEHCWRTSDFLSYWPGLDSGISTIAEKYKKEN